jgi:hypothetical protein
VPTFLFLASGLRWLEPAQALFISQLFCITLLGLIGARVGWVLDKKLMPSALGAMFTSGIGFMLAGLKYIIH